MGHVRSLEQARRLGDRLVVAVNDDASVRRQKGRRASDPAGPRAARASSRRWPASTGSSAPRRATPIGSICATRPDVLAKGGDWSFDEIVGREEVEATGGRVVRLDVVPGERTTQLVERIRRGARRS
ncbi:MAG: D-glycero-beta-D-manno-heptose 1-phosphate adenylyltransferase [Myxococcota bacterium]